METSAFIEISKEYLVLALVLLITVIIGRIIYWVLRVLVKKAVSRTKTKFDDLFLGVVEGPLVFLLFLIGAWIGFRDVSSIPADIMDVIYSVLKVIIIADVAYFVSSIISKGITMHLAGKKITEGSRIEKALPALGKIMNIGVVIIAIVLTFEVFGMNVTSLITGLGIGGLAVAFAAKDTIASVFASVSILTDHTFKIGDRIKFQAHEGVVEEVGVRSTKIKTDSGSEVIIPNTRFATFPVENLSKRKKGYKDMTIKVSSGLPNSKLLKAVEHIKSVVNDTEGIKDDPSVNIVSIGSEAAEIKLVYTLTGEKRDAEIRQEVLLGIKSRFEKSKINFA